MSRPTFPPDCQSALARHLTEGVWAALAGTKDQAGFPFEAAIASGIQNPDSAIGVYAGSADSFRAFAALFDPVMREYHGERIHSSDMDAPVTARLQQGLVRSTRMRVARNLAGTPFGAAITAEQRRDVEARVADALRPLGGHYLSLAEMSMDERRRLIDDHLLFKDGDRFLAAAGLTRDWPDGRGIWMDDSRELLVWVNEEDHLRIISMQAGGDIAAVWQGLRQLHAHLDGALPFARDDRLGFLTSCPTNLGTGLRASVHVHLPGLAPEQRGSIAAQHHVQVRGVHGEHSEGDGDVFDISNKRRLGYSEAELLADLVAGTNALVRAAEAAGHADSDSAASTK